MKKLAHITLFVALWCGFAALPVLQTGCQTAPNERVQAVQTLKIVGQSAKASIDAAAQLLANGQITVDQFNKVAVVFDTQFQPTYRLAVIAAHSDLSSIASPDLVGMSVQIAALVAELTLKK